MGSALSKMLCTGGRKKNKDPIPLGVGEHTPVDLHRTTSQGIERTENNNICSNLTGGTGSQQTFSLPGNPHFPSLKPAQPPYTQPSNARVDSAKLSSSVASPNPEQVVLQALGGPAAANDSSQTQDLTRAQIEGGAVHQKLYQSSGLDGRKDLAPGGDSSDRVFRRHIAEGSYNKEGPVEGYSSISRPCGPGTDNAADDLATLIKNLDTSNTNGSPVWEKAVAMLQGKGLERLERDCDAPVNALIREVETLQQEKKRLSYKNADGKEIYIADQIFGQLNRYAAIGDIALQHHPDVVALVWAGFRLLLNVGSAYTDTLARILSSLGYLAWVICCGAIYERVYLNMELGLITSTLEESLTKQYVLILEYLLHAKDHLENSTTVQVFKSLSSSLTTMIEEIKSTERETRQSVEVIEIKVSKIERFKQEGSRIQLARHLKDVGEQLRNVENTLDLCHAGIKRINEFVDKQIVSTTLNWVSTIQYGEIHSGHCARRTENTCLWLRDNAKFNDWLLSRSSSPVLWLRGNAGTGKTILASFAIELLKERATSTEDCIAYFYCSMAEPDRSSPDSILRALLRQICVGYSSASDGLPSALVDAKDKKQRESGGLLTVKESGQLIIQLSKQLTGLWIVVDALDECNMNTRKELFQALKTIQKDGSNVHVFVTGRNEGDIIAYMKDYEDYHIQPEDNSDDIMLYIRSELDEIYSCPSKSYMVDDMRDHEQDILNALQANVDGMFLSVQLRIQALWHETTIEGVRTTMGVLPQGLETMYDEIFRRIKEQSPTDQRAALKAIQWLFYATDDFTPGTILEALHDHFHTIRKLSEEAIQKKIEHISRACCGLTVYDRETGLLRFSHATVVEYLGKGSRECLRGGQEWILDRCFSLLTCSVTERPDPASLTSARQDLVTYTMRNWGIHLRNCNLTHNWSTFLDPSSTSYIFWACNIGRIIPTLSSPLGKQISLAWTAAFYGLYDIINGEAFIISPTCKNVAGRTPLHHLAEHGDLTLVGNPDQISSLVNERDEKDLTPLMLAAKSDKSENVGFLLAIREQDDGREPGGGGLAICDINARDTNGLTALQHAALAGHFSVVENLMKDPGLKINEKTELGETALCLAAGNGHTSTVEILLEDEEVEPNFKDMSENTPLMIAADRGYEEVVKVLIAHQKIDANCGSGEDNLFIKAAEENKVWLVQELLKAKNIEINRKGLLGWTALANAANHGFIEILKLLLNEPGVDTEVKSSQGQTALSLTAQQGRLDCLRALLSHEVDVNAADVNGWTSLHKATWEGHTEILKELLSHGANADARAGDSRTPLYLAAQQGSLNCLRALLSHGVNVNAAQDDGWTPLHTAAFGGHTETLEELLSHGADTDARTGDSRTPLYLAALEGSLDCLQALLSHGVDVNAADVKGWTPLHIAAYKGHTEILKELLSHGADADATTGGSHTPLYLAAQQGSLNCLRALLSHGVNVNAAQDDGWTPLHTAAFGGHTETLEELLSHGANTDARTGDSRTPLYLAALEGSLDCLRALLSHGVDVNAADVKGWTPLHIAAYKGHTEILKELLSHGADADATTGGSHTPLYLAAQQGSLDCLRALLSHGVNVNAAQEDGWTPLHTAAFGGHTEILKELQSQGADADARTGNSRTPLYLAAQQGSLDCLRALLSHWVNVNAAQEDGWTPLHTAAFGGHTEILKELLSQGADADARTGGGDTPLYLAAQQGSLDCLRALLSHGVNVNAAEVDGWTPLHRAAWKVHTEILKELLILSHGADADARTKDSRTPLHLAAQQGSLDCLRALLSHGVNVNAAEVDGCTPLHIAAFGTHTEILKKLLFHGADADARTGGGDTPLYLAAQQGSLDCLRALLSHGVNVNAADVNGWTPLHIAASMGHTILVSVLLEQPRIDPYDINGYHQSPLMLARSQGHSETYAKLLVHYDKLHEMDLDVNTHLLLAASSGEIRIFERAVERGGYSINYQDELGRTALMMAAGSGNAEVVKRLLKEDGIDVNLRSTYTFLPNSPSEAPRASKHGGHTALYFAGSSTSIEAITALLDDPRVDPAVAGNHGTTPLLSASESGLVGPFEKILERYDPHDKLQEIDGDDDTHLLLAAKSGKTRIIELVLERGGHDINFRNKLGNTALIRATIEGHPDAVKLLLKQEGIDVNIANNEGKTAFDIAKEKNQASIMELLEPHLVEKGT